MDQMKEAIGVDDSRAISQCLTRIRHGRARLSRRSQPLPSLAINYDPKTKAYYNLGKATEDNLEAGVPQSIVGVLTSHARSRTRSIGSAVGEAGLGKAISDGLLSGPDALDLLKTVPMLQLEALRDNVDRAIVARREIEARPELRAGHQGTGSIQGPTDTR